MTSPHPADSALKAFSGGELAQSARAEIYAHLETCGQCRGVVSSLSATPSPTGKPLATGVRSSRTREDPLLGQFVGEYRILERLAQGGMGTLYRGEQPVIGKAVAIKVLLPTPTHDATGVQRMIGEARAVNEVRHPNIVDIFSFGQLPDGRPYVVMQLLEGQSLAALLLERGRLTVAQTLVVLSQTMAALEAAHGVGVVHRDLKPDNIFVDTRADPWVVTLLDFGIAAHAGPTGSNLTIPGVVMGTPGFMAPERVRGARAVTPKADIYAMGVVAWTVLAGHEPFAGGTAVDVMRHQLVMSVPPLRPEAKEVPVALETLVTQMLDKDPERRPSATQVRAALAALSRPTGSAPAVVAAEPPAGVKARGRWRTRGALVAIVALGALGAGGWWLSLPEPAPDLSPRPIARPAAPTPLPDPVAEPTPLPQPAPAAQVERERDTAMTWRCSRLLEVTPVEDVGRWRFFALKVIDETQVLVTTYDFSKEDHQKLKRLHKTVAACRGSKKLIVARQTNDRHPGLLTKDLVLFKGIEVKVGDLTVIAPPRVDGGTPGVGNR